MNPVSEDEGRILQKAIFNAGAQLGLENEQIYKLLQVRHGNQPIDFRGNPQAYTTGLLLVECYKVVVSIVGSDSKNILHFMNTSNNLIGAKPVEMLLNSKGVSELIDVMSKFQSK